MNRERRNRIEDAFDAVLDAGPAERSRVLAEVCGSDDELLREVQAMLEAHDRAEGLLEHGAHAIADSLLHEVQPIQPRIGAYRILRELGRGGMGVVYLGERDDGQFRRQVAIKILRDPDPQLQARMLSERQILASLQHPNIAALLDGGVTHDGRPYLVMEHVEGLPIDVHCDRMRLSLPQRLRLFIVVARAVEYAHRNLVVHRDLKSSNILVTTSGAVKLLDFGIAKLLNPSLGPAGHPQTRPEQRILTPEYASPEQIRGETLTTASDVYSLGVILYELLSGQAPYRLEGLTTPQVLEVVCERDPAPPSARVMVEDTSGSSDVASSTVPAAVAEARAAQTPERLQRALRGDLDAIVSMALRKEPTRRYGSAELLAQDIGAYLDGLPVSARKGTRRYRIGKVLRRNRAAAIASALIVLSLVLGAIVALWQAGLAGRERDRAEQALSTTQEALRQSDEMSAFLISLFEAGDPILSPGEELTARDLLRRGIARADQLADQPLVQARMLGVMGRVYESMARYEEAQQLTERAIATRQVALGVDHESVGELLIQLGLILRWQSRYDSAAVVMRRALDIRRHASGVPPTQLADAMYRFAQILVFQSRLDEAEQLYREALDTLRATVGYADGSALDPLNALGGLLRLKGDLPGAEATFREALAVHENRGTVETLNGTALILQVGGTILEHDSTRIAEAESLFNRALDIRRAIYGANHPELAWPLTSLARARAMQGDIAGAERYMNQDLEIQKRAFGPDHPGVSYSRGEWGLILMNEGRLKEAEGPLRTALEMERRELGPRNARVATTLVRLGIVLVGLGRSAEAEPLLEEALAQRREIFGPSGFTVAEAMAVLASARIVLGELDEAERLLQDAHAISSRYFPEHHRDIRLIYEYMARLHEARGHADEARRYRVLSGAR